MSKEKSEAAAADATPAQELLATPESDSTTAEALDRLTSQLAAIFSVLAALVETLHRAFPPEGLCCDVTHAAAAPEKTAEEQAVDDRNYAEALAVRYLGHSAEQAAEHVAQLGAEKAAQLVAAGRGGFVGRVAALLGL